MLYIIQAEADREFTRYYAQYSESRQWTFDRNCARIFRDKETAEKTAQRLRMEEMESKFPTKLRFYVELLDDR